VITVKPFSVGRKTSSSVALPDKQSVKPGCALSPKIE
jgi:hypothetical protein